MIKEKGIVDFSLPGEEKRWEIVNDVVMGGVSKSQLSITPDKTALFRGEVSLENFGGFASVRTYPQDYQLESYKGISIRIKGDGKRYRLRLRTDDKPDGIAYQALFNTKSGKWINVNLPFKDFIPVYRGRMVSGASPLEPSRIQRIGFMIADKQAGPFNLEISWIKAYSEEDL
jgi:NADH dehydrogenase [ubiquinone] 1 alpha subcomplex assembly factor 1